MERARPEETSKNDGMAMVFKKRNDDFARGQNEFVRDWQVKIKGDPKYKPNVKEIKMGLVEFLVKQTEK